MNRLIRLLALIALGAFATPAFSQTVLLRAARWMDVVSGHLYAPAVIEEVALMHATDDGWVDGPRVFPVGYYITSTGGHCDLTGFAPGILERGPEEGVADGPDEIQKAVRFQIKHGAKWSKCAQREEFCLMTRRWGVTVLGIGAQGWRKRS